MGLFKKVLVVGTIVAGLAYLAKRNKDPLKKLGKNVEKKFNKVMDDIKDINIDEVTQKAKDKVIKAGNKAADIAGDIKDKTLDVKDAIEDQVKKVADKTKNAIKDHFEN